MSALTERHVAVVEGDGCPICNKPIRLGEHIFIHIRDKYPYLCEDTDDQDYDVFSWHQSCDPGTIAADEAVYPPHRRCDRTPPEDPT